MTRSSDQPKNKRSITFVTDITTSAKITAQNAQLEEETQLEIDLREARESAAVAIAHAQATKKALQSSDSLSVIQAEQSRDNSGEENGITEDDDADKSQMSTLEKATAKLRARLRRSIRSKKDRKK